MAVTPIKAERVVRTALGLLERETPLPSLIWQNAGGDFRGAKGDAITIRLPAYVKSKSRTIRPSTGSRTPSNLVERTVIVTLDKDLYNKVPITDPELTLDIDNFNEQITIPVMNGMGRGIEDEIIAEIAAAPYHANNQFDVTVDANGIPDPGDMYRVAIRARQSLNNARVPNGDRAIICGSAVESAFLNDEQFIRADRSGSTQTFREGEIGRVGGFSVFSIPGLNPNKAYAFHRTAFVLSSRAPLVPKGAPWGASMSWNGFAVRVIQAMDNDTLVDNFHSDVYVGTNYVADYGAFDGNGKFEPSEEPDLDHDTPLFVRAVEITLEEGS
jgi:hypothetical protein